MRRLKDGLRLSGAMAFAVCILAFLSSCSLLAIRDASDYESVARISNTVWARLYFAFTDVKFPGYDTIIYKDTRWRASDSPVTIDKNMYILPGVTLSIDPGVKVLLGDNILVTIRGAVVARGTRDAPVVFTRAGDSGNWMAIEVVSGIEGNGDDAETDTAVFKNCIFEHGGTVRIVSSRALVKSCIFRDNDDSALKFYYTGGTISECLFYGNSTLNQSESGNGAAINIYTDKEVLVENNEIRGNVSSGGRDGGGGICAFAYDKGRVSIVGNRLENNRSDRKGGGIFAYASTVSGNNVIGNEADLSGGGIYAIDCVVQDNVVSSNGARDGGGIYAEGGVVYGNLVTGNSGSNGSALYYLGDGDIMRNSFLGDGEDRSGSLVSVLGNPRIRRNNIIAGKGRALSVLSHELAPDLDATENYWGTTDSAVIEDLVADWFDDTSVGLVDWRPFLDGAAADAHPMPAGFEPVLSKTVRPPAPDELYGLVGSDLVLGRNDLKRYKVSGNILVDTGAALSIEPGTTLLIGKDVTIRVRGRLAALGKPGAPIRFTGRGGSVWGNLFFENRSTGSSGKNSTMRHCIIENGRGIVMDGKGADLFNCTVRNNNGTGVRIKESSVSVKNCRIYGNVSDSDGGGIYVYGSRLVYIEGNEIRDNRAADGGGIFAYGYQSNAAVDIKNNSIEGNYSAGDGGGVWMSRSSMSGNMVAGNRAQGKGGGVYCSFALMDGNRIIGNTADEGGGLYVDANGSIHGNMIEGNTAKGPFGGGVYLDYWGVSRHNKIFSGNTIEENSASGPNPAGGVCMKGTLEFTGNVIRNNRGIQLMNLSPEKDGPVSVPNCYWGVVSKAGMDKLIYDGKDDPTLSVVEYEPLAATAEKALSAATPIESR